MIQQIRDLGFTAAYHVTPLHYLPNILLGGQLLSKYGLRVHGGMVATRPSSQDKDVKLGFADYVHAFLIRAYHGELHGPRIPILKDKLGKGLPHVCLRIPLEFFTNAIMCWWNIAKGHPKGSCAGWSAERILEEWAGYRIEPLGACVNNPENN